MLPLTRSLLALGACLFLCQCQLINTALRLWPYLLLVENDGKVHTHGDDPAVRGREVEARGARDPLQVQPTGGAAIVLHR